MSSPMNCERARDLLWSGQRTRLTDSERRQLELHLASCSSCSEAGATIERLRTSLAREGRLRPSRSLQAALLDVPRRDEQSTARRLVPLALPLAALLCVASSLALWSIAPRLGPQRTADRSPSQQEAPAPAGAATSRDGFGQPEMAHGRRQPGAAGTAEAGHVGTPSVSATPVVGHATQIALAPRPTTDLARGTSSGGSAAGSAGPGAAGAGPTEASPAGGEPRPGHPSEPRRTPERAATSGDLGAPAATRTSPPSGDQPLPTAAIGNPVPTSTPAAEGGVPPSPTPRRLLPPTPSSGSATAPPPAPQPTQGRAPLPTHPATAGPSTPTRVATPGAPGGPLTPTPTGPAPSATVAPTRRPPLATATNQPPTAAPTMAMTASPTVAATVSATAPVTPTVAVTLTPDGLGGNSPSPDNSPQRGHAHRHTSSRTPSARADPLDLTGLPRHTSR